MGDSDFTPGGLYKALLFPQDEVPGGLETSRHRSRGLGLDIVNHDTSVPANPESYFSCSDPGVLGLEGDERGYIDLG